MLKADVNKSNGKTMCRNEKVLVHLTGDFKSEMEMFYNYGVKRIPPLNRINC